MPRRSNSPTNQSLKIGALAVPAAVHSPSPSASAPAGAEEKKKEEDKVICRTTYSTTSRMGGGRGCMEQSKWDEAARRSKKAAGDYSVNESTRTSPGASGQANIDNN